MISGTPPIQFVVDATLDQSIDPFAGAAPGMLADLVNLRKDLTGRLVKRNGESLVAQSPVALGAGAIRIIPHGDSVAAIDRDKIYSISPGADRTAYVDRAPKFTLERAQSLVGDGGTSHLYAGAASASGITLHVWVDADTQHVMALAVDDETGAVIRGPDNLSGSGPQHVLARVVADSSGNFFVFAHRSTFVEAYTLSASALAGGTSWPVATTIISNLETVTPSFDISLGDYSGADKIYLAYNHNTSGTRGVTLVRLSTALATDATTVYNGGQSHGVSVFSQRGIALVWVGYVLTSAPTATVLRLYDEAGAFLATRAGLDFVTSNAAGMGFGHVSSTSVCHVASTSDITVAPRGLIIKCLFAWNGSSITVDIPVFCYGMVLASYPFSDGRDVFAWLDVGKSTSYTTSLPYNCIVLAQMTFDGGTMPALPVNDTAGSMPHLRVAAGRTYWGLYALINYTPQKVYASSSDTDAYVWDASSITVRRDTGGSSVLGVTEYRTRRMDPGNSAALIGAEVNGLTVTSGGSQPYIYDGQRFTELGFAYPPAVHGETTLVTSASGGSMAAGTYSYAITYEYYDATGLKHQSAPSLAGSITHASGSVNKVTVTIPNLKVTAKQDYETERPNDTQVPALQIVVWRTLSTGATIYYRVGQVVNAVNSAATQYVDTSADGTISTNEILYFSRGELANEMPPPSHHLVPYGSRMAGIDSEFRTRIFFSKPIQTGRGPEFSSALQIYVPGIGPLTALAEMDGSLYAFSANGIALASYGSGVDAAGAGTWPEPQIISRAAGCIDARALCVSQEGIVFCSSNGGELRVWLLPRGGSAPVEIGRKVRKYLSGKMASFTTSDVPTVAACVNWAAEYRVAIKITGTVSAVRRSIGLEYDYLNRDANGLGVWNTTKSAGDAEGTSTACVADGKLWYGCETDEAVWVSDDATYADDGDWIPYTIATQYIKATGLSPIGKVNAIDYAIETTDDSQLQLYMLDGSATVSTAFNLTSVTPGATLHRQWQPAARRLATGNGFQLKIVSTEPNTGADSADSVPRSISIDYVAAPGMYRAAATEMV